MEALWQTERGAPLLLFALPERARRGATTIAIEVPKGASLILTHDLDGEVKGLDDFRDQHPPVAPLFFAFRVMVGMGVLMLAVSLVRRLVLAAGATRGCRAGCCGASPAMTFSGWVADAGRLARRPRSAASPSSSTACSAPREAASTVPGAIIALTLDRLRRSSTSLLLVAYMVVLTHLARKRRRGARAAASRRPASCSRPERCY